MGICVIDLWGDSDDVIVTVASNKKDQKDANEGKKVPVPAPQLEIIPVERKTVKRDKRRHRSEDDSASN